MRYDVSIASFGFFQVYRDKSPFWVLRYIALVPQSVQEGRVVVTIEPVE